MNKLDTQYRIKYTGENGSQHSFEATLDELIKREFDGAYIDFPDNNVYLFDCYEIDEIDEIDEIKD